MHLTDRILVTGGSGFIGTNLVGHYLRPGATVLNLDQSAPRDPALAACWKKNDILDASGLRARLAEFQPTHIVHLAARTDLEGRRIEDYMANTQGVTNLIDAAAGLPTLQRILFCSSRLVCRIGYPPRGPHDYCPTTLYGQSKVIGEQLVYAAKNLSCDWLIVRPTSIWGPGFDLPYRNFFDAVQRGRYLHPRGRRVLKSFGYIGNSVHQLDRLTFAPRERVHGRMLYLCDYQPIEVLEWAGMIREAFDAPRVRSVPVAALRFAALAGDLLERLGMRNAPLTSFRLDNLMTQMLHETADLEAICGPSPYSLAQGVRLTVDWMRQAAQPA